MGLPKKHCILPGDMPYIWCHTKRCVSDVRSRHLALGHPVTCSFKQTHFITSEVICSAACTKWISPKRTGRIGIGPQKNRLNFGVDLDEGTDPGFSITFVNNVFISINKTLHSDISRYLWVV